MTPTEALKITGYDPTPSPDIHLIDSLVEIDRQHYGEYGADHEYFKRKLASENARLFVVSENDKPTGFCVMEIMNPGQPMTDFSNLSNSLPQEKWMHIIAFTTKLDFQDKESDGVLLTAVEQAAHTFGCSVYCVPLSVDHPYPEAYEFFHGNGYRETGTLNWVAGPNELIPCNFLVKSRS
jgi:hypothetical protein